MSPTEISTDSSSTIKVVNFPKLAADGFNWPTYLEWINNAIIAVKRLQRHLSETVHKPEELVEQDGKWYKMKGENQEARPLTNDELDKHENKIDVYQQPEVQVCKIIYGTIDKSNFVCIKGEPTIAAIWKKLMAIHADKESMFQTDLVTKLQTAWFTEGDKMSTHLTNMISIYKCFIKIGSPITDESFNT